MAVKLIDVSDYQPDVDWKKVKGGKFAGAWIKATEGMSWEARHFTGHRLRARQAGLRVGAYHFARPDLHPWDPEGEAHHFVRTVGPLWRRDLRPVLDFEVNYHRHLSDRQAVEWARRWSRTVRKRLGVWPIFYSYSSLIHDLSADVPIGWGLWLANYGPNDGKRRPVAVPKPWKKFLAHQYTSNGRVPGIEGPVDVNWAPKLRPLLAHPWRGLL